jgi:peptidoglycan biosynthesis protein MviN/MurJ (putative lipid II flippase)
VANILFPLFSSDYYTGRLEALKRRFDGGQRFILMVFIPLTIFIVFFNRDIIVGLYQRGHFDPGTAERTASYLFIYGFSLLFNAFYMLPSYLLQASQHNKSVSTAGCLYAVINIAGSLLFSRLIGPVGIPLAFLIALTVYNLLLHRSILRNLRMSYSPGLFLFILKSIAVSTASAGAIWLYFPTSLIPLFPRAWQGLAAFLVKASVFTVLSAGLNIWVHRRELGTILKEIH